MYICLFFSVFYLPSPSGPQTYYIVEERVNYVGAGAGCKEVFLRGEVADIQGMQQLTQINNVVRMSNSFGVYIRII